MGLFTSLFGGNKSNECQEDKQKKKKEITLRNERLSEYFEEETTEDEMMDVIFELLEKWKQKRGSEENE